MKTSTLMFLEFLFFDGVALAWAAWEYWQIRPGKPDKAPESRPSPEDTSPEYSGHPEG
jgi:hypothetical protein